MIIFALLALVGALGFAAIKKQQQQQPVTQVNFGGLPVGRARPDLYPSSQDVKAVSNMVRVEGGPFVFNPGYGLQKKGAAVGGTGTGAGGTGRGGTGGGGIGGAGGGGGGHPLQ